MSFLIEGLNLNVCIYVYMLSMNNLAINNNVGY